jgi:hypothetical protein
MPRLMRLSERRKAMEYEKPTYRNYDNNADQWQEWKRQAAILETSELQRHARVSTSNRHSCHDCFCCAAGEVLEERRAAKEA